MLRSLTNETAELLQAMIRNACVNEGTEDSGHEYRNADLIEAVISGPGIDVERFESAPGRVSLVARMDGLDDSAPSLCLSGHTDVVPVSPEGWREDPFGGELIGGEIWGRGAVDMLNLTASMAVAMRHLADQNFRPRGDLILLAAADEEAGSGLGARWLAEHHPDAIKADYVLTESGGVHIGAVDSTPRIVFRVAEKGVAWRRLRIRGTPGHGSMPFSGGNALVKAARVIERVASYRSEPRCHERWRAQVSALDIDGSIKELLLDPTTLDDGLDSVTEAGLAGALHACTHTTLSPNVAWTQHKINVIPDIVDVDVDIRTLPGEGEEEVRQHLQAALGDLSEDIEVVPLMTEFASASPVETPLWRSIQHAISRSYPTAEATAQLHIGFTDARVHRKLGAVAYGAGLMSPSISLGEFHRRFHGNNERVDLESLDLTTQFWIDVATDLLGT